MIEVENLRVLLECVLRSTSSFERVLLANRCRDNVLWRRRIPARAIVPERRWFDVDDEPMIALAEERIPDQSIVCCRTSSRVRSVNEREEKERERTVCLAEGRILHQSLRAFTFAFVSSETPHLTSGRRARLMFSRIHLLCAKDFLRFLPDQDERNSISLMQFPFAQLRADEERISHVARPDSPALEREMIIELEMITLINSTSTEKKKEKKKYIVAQHLSLSLYSSDTTHRDEEEDIHCEDNEVSDTLFKRDNGASGSDRPERTRDSCCTNQHLAVTNHAPRKRGRVSLSLVLGSHLSNSRRGEGRKRRTGHRIGWITHRVGVVRLVRSRRGCGIEVSHHCLAGREAFLQLLFLFPILGSSILEPDLRERRRAFSVDRIVNARTSLHCTYSSELSSQTRERELIRLAENERLPCLSVISLT